MAHTIKLKYGSPTSWSYIDLTDSSHGNVDYYPGTPGEGAEEITERGRWRVAGTSVSDLITKIGAIEDLFRKAAAYEMDQVGAYQVRVTIQPDGVSETWESPIYEGRLELTEDIFDVDWANKITEVVLIWRRAPYWENLSGPANVHNSNGNDTSITVYNCNDGSGSSPTKKENYVDIAADQVFGDLPAPAMIFLAYAANSIDEIYIYHNAKTNPTSVVYHTEVGTGADTTDATRSGGYYKTVAVPAAGNGYDFETTSASLAAVGNGIWLRFLLCAKFNGTLKAKPYLTLAAKEYYGPASMLVSDGTYFEIFDLGLVRMPSILAENTNFTIFNSVTVGINLYSTPGLNVSVDYFEYCPIDSFAHAKLDAAVDITSGLVVVDCRDGLVMGGGGSYDVTTMGTLYGGIYLEPGLEQRLVFKFKNGKEDHMSTFADLGVSRFCRKRTL